LSIQCHILLLFILISCSRLAWLVISLFNLSVGRIPHRERPPPQSYDARLKTLDRALLIAMVQPPAWILIDSCPAPDLVVINTLEVLRDRA